MSEQQEKKYEPLSEQELGEIEKEAKGDTGWDRWWTLDYMRLIATIRDLQGQVSAYEGTYQHKCQEQLKQVLEEVTLLKASIAKVMDAYAAAPGRAITYEHFMDIMVDTIVRG